MSSGYAPLAAAILREPIAQAFWGAPGTEFAHGHTYAGNPVSCAAGLASIREIVERKLPDNARRVGAHLVQRLDAPPPARHRRRHPGQGPHDRGGVRAGSRPPSALLAGHEDRPPDRASGLLDNGLLLRFDPHWVAFGPALIVTEADIDQMVDILEQSIREVLREL